MDLYGIRLSRLASYIFQPRIAETHHFSPAAKQCILVKEMLVDLSRNAIRNPYLIIDMKKRREREGGEEEEEEEEETGRRRRQGGGGGEKRRERKCKASQVVMSLSEVHP